MHTPNNFLWHPYGFKLTWILPTILNTRLFLPIFTIFMPISLEIVHFNPYLTPLLAIKRTFIHFWVILILERIMLMLGCSGRDRLKLMLKISSSDWLIIDFLKGFLGAAHQTIYMTGWVLLHWICLNGLSFLDLTFFVLEISNSIDDRYQFV